MTCEHIRKMYQLCEVTGLRLSSSDVIRITCHECNDIEVCPSVMTEEYDATDASTNPRPQEVPPRQAPSAQKMPN